MSAARWATRLLRAGRLSLAREEAQHARGGHVCFTEHQRAFNAGSARRKATVESASTSLQSARNARPNVTALGIVVAAGLAYGFATARSTLAEAPDEPLAKERLIRLEELHEHNRTADTYWVNYYWAQAPMSQTCSCLYPMLFRYTAETACTT